MMKLEDEFKREEAEEEPALVKLKGRVSDDWRHMLEHLEMLKPGASIVLID